MSGDSDVESFLDRDENGATDELVKSDLILERETHVQNLVGSNPSSVAERHATKSLDALGLERVLNLIDERERDFLGRVRLEPFAEVEISLLVGLHRSGVTL